MTGAAPSHAAAAERQTSTALLRQRILHLAIRSRRSSDHRCRASRLPQRRPRAFRCALDDARRSRPAAPHRSGNRLLHNRSGRARPVPFDDLPQHGDSRWTIAVDPGRSVPLAVGGPTPRLLDWRTGSGFDLFEGAHDGYGPLVHHRAILARPGCWFIVDRLVEAGTHRADIHWHFHPSWEIASTRPGTVCARHRRWDESRGCSLFVTRAK